MRSQIRLRDVGTRGRTKPTLADDAYLAYLEANSHLAESREVIRDGIKRGLIRVLPACNDEERVRIIRTRPEGPPPPSD